MVIADLDVIQLDFRGELYSFNETQEKRKKNRSISVTLLLIFELFHFYSISTGDNVDCWMEIQHGKGPWAPPVSGIVPLGSTLTLVVAINDYRGKKMGGVFSSNFQYIAS
jgi:hypothetical protein